MLLKTLGVVLTTALAAFTLLYWVTDDARRDALDAEHEEELRQFGEIIFSNDPAEPAAAGCANCHGPDGTGGEAGAPVIGPNLHSRSIADKLRANPNYVHLVVSFGGVVVSGNVTSAMPAWSYEVGGPLNEQQIEAVVTLVEGWAAEAAEAPLEEVPDTVEAGAEVFTAGGCASCHGAELEGTTAGPNIQTIGSGVITDLPVEPTGLDQMIADYEADPRNFLELWIRDSAVNYNDGVATGMPAHPESRLSESQLTALITFLLAQTGE
jgi:mono/diheme cytochrome c family protein